MRAISSDSRFIIPGDRMNFTLPAIARLDDCRIYSRSALLILASAPALAQTAPLPPTPAPVQASGNTLPFSINVLDRSRTNAVSFYNDAPYTTTYPYVEQLLRVSVTQKIKHFDYQLEVSENNVFDVPTTSVDPVAARGQLYLGGTYYAANNSNTLPVAASFRQGFLRYRGKGPDTSLRIGRFEYFDGQETTPKDPTLLWLQNNRISQRLIGNFGFSNGQRSFDSIDGHYGKGTWDLTAMGGRVTQGVFNMNANPELNVDIQYMAYTKRQFKDHMLFRVFGLGYHDGRTGLTKTDNRSATVRALDHQNIRIGTYGADMITSIPAGPGAFDFLFWGVLQNGQWGYQKQHSGAVAIEGGYRLTSVASKPWLRGGFLHASGDTNATDDQHNTFFQVLPTPRIYARFPFYDMQNSNDQFVQMIDNPMKNLELRADLHFLHLASNTDLWYQGGGPYDNKVFGYTGRTANLRNSFASVFDISSDYALNPSFSVNLYYAHSVAKSAILGSFPTGPAANYGYLELIYKWGIRQKPAPSK
jgi:hypothetical protein